MGPAMADAGTKVLSFTAAGERFALPSATISEIIRPPALTRCPLSPASLLGVANLRGTVLPVVSFAALAAGRAPAEAPAPSAAARVVVVEHPVRVGLWVDAPALAPASDHQVAPLQAWLDRDFGAALAAPTADRRPKATARPRSDNQPQAETQLIAFPLAGQHYALPVRDVLETLAMPPALTQLPGAGPGMLGVTRLRDALLPIVSLPHLLGLPSGAPSTVIVTRIGAHQVGLAVERIEAILHVPDDSIDLVPPVLTRGLGEARIGAICRHRDGRLISILSPAGLFDPATADRILAAGAASEAPQEAETNLHEASERFVGFRLGGEHYGVPAGTVDAVLRRPPSVTRVPHAPDFLLGLINVRGQAVPLIDQRARFGAPPPPSGPHASPAPAPFVMIVSVQGRQAALCVDGLDGMLSATPAQLTAAPIASGTAPVIDRIACIEREGRMIILVDPAALLTTAESQLLAALGQRQAPAA